MILLMLYTLLWTTFAQKHTSIFNEYWNTYGNTNNMFYHPDTFGKNIYTDPCEKITYNTKYKNYVNQYINPCIGKWCIDYKFNCLQYNSSCYQVEHIIDKKGQEYDIECTLIAGNLVMAYGKWNNGLGGFAGSNYTNSVIEKTIVYGKEIMDDVRHIIETCNTSCVNHYIVNVNDNNADIERDITLIIIGISLVLGLLSGGTIFCYNKCIKKNNNELSLIPLNDIISDL